MGLKIGKCHCDKKISDSSADGQNVAHFGLGYVVIGVRPCIRARWFCQASPDWNARITLICIQWRITRQRD